MADLTPHEFEDVRVLFSRAIDLPATMREDFVRRAAGYSDRQREEVLNLLVNIPDDISDSDDESIGDPLVDSQDAILRDKDAIPGHHILGVIGRGGMGNVYHAESTETGQEVAIKVLRGGHGEHANERSEKRFQRECDALLRLKHARISRYLDSGHVTLEDQRRPYVVMEFVNGVPLGKYIERESPSVDTRVGLLAELADAIAYCHDSNIIHRDLKPDNVLVDNDGHIKLLDFGTAHLTTEDGGTTFHTIDGSLLGTIQYMSPEQLQGGSESPRPGIDIYSLGVVAFKVLTSSLPYTFAGLTFPETVATILKAPVDWSAVSTDEIPARLRDILRVALNKTPSKRYATMRDFAADFRNYLTGETLIAQKIVRRRASRRLLVTGATASLAIFATVFIVALVQRNFTSASAVVVPRMCAHIEQLDHRRHLEPLATDEILALITDFKATEQDLATMAEHPCVSQMRRYLWFRLGELHFFLGSRRNSVDALREARNYWVQTRSVKYDSAAVETVPGFETLRARMHVVGEHKASTAMALAASSMSFYETPHRHATDALKLRHNAWRSFARAEGLDEDLAAVVAANNGQFLEIGFFLNEVGHSRVRIGYLTHDVGEMDRGIVLLQRVMGKDFLRWARGAKGSAAVNLTEAYGLRFQVTHDLADVRNALKTAEMATGLVTHASNLRSYAVLQRLITMCSIELDIAENMDRATIDELATLTVELKETGDSVSVAVAERAMARALLTQAMTFGDDDQRLMQADSLATRASTVLMKDAWPYQDSTTHLLCGEIELALWESDGNTMHLAEARQHAKDARRSTHPSEDVNLARDIARLLEQVEAQSR